jgi:YggT family protein
MSLGFVLAGAVEVYLVAILVWVIASWIPAARRYRAVRAVGKVTEPFLRLFRAVIPPMGGLDFSPILAILLLQLLAGWLRGLPL